MAVDVTTNGRRSLGALLRDLAEGSVTLVRQEAGLAKLELSDAARHAGLGVGMFAAGGVLALLGALALLFARRGLSLLSPSALAPDQTVETLKEDKEWLKRRMTSGATSS